MAKATPAESKPNKRPMKNDDNNGVQHFDNLQLK
jgi:hypothetical protein